LAFGTLDDNYRYVLPSSNETGKTLFANLSLSAIGTPFDPSPYVHIADCICTLRLSKAVIKNDPILQLLRIADTVDKNIYSNIPQYRDIEFLSSDKEMMNMANKYETELSISKKIMEQFEEKKNNIDTLIETNTKILTSVRRHESTEMLNKYLLQVLTDMKTKYNIVEDCVDD